MIAPSGGTIGRDQSLHFHAALTNSTHMVMTFVSIETRRCAPLATPFCSSSHFFALLQPKIRRYFRHSILIWTLLQPTSSNNSLTYIATMVVTSSKFAKDSGELRHSFCGALVVLCAAFLQVESVGGLIVDSRPTIVPPMWLFSFIIVCW